MPFPVDIRFVRQAEAKLSRKLPAAYVDKMCRDNGGQIDTDIDEWELYPIFDDSDRKRLKRTCNDILHETKSAREWPNFPVNALAIGSNGTGDQLIFLADPSSDIYGDPVYWWDHETGNYHKLADDFQNLVAGP